MQKQLIECVPNISEGRDSKIIETVSQIVETVEGVKLLDVDPGKAAHGLDGSQQPLEEQIAQAQTE